MQKEITDRIPVSVTGIIENWIRPYHVIFRIKNGRKSKLGDYRSPIKSGHPHIISINRDLGSLSFLITLTHEIAHLLVSVNHNHRVTPHGEVWKKTYRALMSELYNHDVFPESMHHVIRSHISRAPSSTSRDQNLVKALREIEQPDSIILDDLQRDSLFTAGDSRVFRKGEKLRSRYKCVCLDNGRHYLIGAVAKVIPR